MCESTSGLHVDLRWLYCVSRMNWQEFSPAERERVLSLLRTRRNDALDASLYNRTNTVADVYAAALLALGEESESALGTWRTVVRDRITREVIELKVLARDYTDAWRQLTERVEGTRVYVDGRALPRFILDPEEIHRVG